MEPPNNNKDAKSCVSTKSNSPPPRRSLAVLDGLRRSSCKLRQPQSPMITSGDYDWAVVVFL